MVISFTLILAAAGTLLAGAVALAATALHVARRAVREAREARASATISALRVAELEPAVADAGSTLKALVAEQERSAATPTRPSLREAVALSRHGASVEELIATCRIGQSEAKLIQMLYGNRQPADAGVPCDIH